MANKISKLQLENGEVIVHIANKLAHKKGKRFIDQDLNRSFPGKKNGNHEQRLATKIMSIVREADLVIDIHSTKSELKDALIVTKLNKKTRECVKIIGPKYLLYMRATKNNALISNAKVGIAFEYGKNNDKPALNKIIAGITRLLVYLGMYSGKQPKSSSNIVWMDVYGMVAKPKNGKVLPEIKNYKLIKKGSPFASANGKSIVAKNDFYPILFGEKYKDIFGFSARLLK